MGRVAVSARMPPCTSDAGHDWEDVTVEPGRVLVAAAVCSHCAARRLVYHSGDGTVTRYARTPRSGTPADLQPPPLLTGAALPVPETALEREQRLWRERRAAMTANGTRRGR
jgi:hypothetical protein